MQLALDTSTDMASIALVDDSEVLAELTWHCGQNHTTQLLPNISYLLGKTSIKSISGIFVAKGPGSYNGLRVGISTAKGLAFSLKVPVVGISTLEADAYQHAETGLPICPIYNAGRGEIATAMYQMKGDRWRRLATEHITTVDALEITDRTIFCGELVSAIAPRLRSMFGELAMIAAPAARLRRASFLAELGQMRLANGDSDDPVTLQPLYLRRPSITTPRHR